MKYKLLVGLVIILLSSKIVSSDTIWIEPVVFGGQVQVQWGDNAYFVSNLTGNNSNSGVSPDDAWLTIQHAVDTVSAGDTVYIMNGTYYEYISPWSGMESGTPQYPITYTNFTGHNPIIDGTGGTSDWTALFKFDEYEHIIIDGLSFKNSCSHGILFHDDSGSASNITIRNCYFENCSDSAINVKGYHAKLNQVLIENNIITDTENGWNDVGEPSDESITVSNCSNFTIRYNTMYDNHKIYIDAKAGSRDGEIHGNRLNTTAEWVCQWGIQGIYVDAQATSCSNIDIYNNTVWGNSTGFEFGTEKGGTLDNISWYNNIYNGSGHGFQVNNHTSVFGSHLKSDCKIINNHIVGNPSICFQITDVNSSFSNFTFRNNLLNGTKGINVPSANLDFWNFDHNFFNVTSSDYYGNDSYNGTITFDDEANGDYRLTGSILAIDGGVSTFAPSFDFDGVSRPVGGLYDIGAFETTRTGATWIQSNPFGGKAIVLEPSSGMWINNGFGGEVTVSGYVQGDWSDYWKMTRISKPVISNPSPSNNSVGNPTSFTWSCSINNPDGNNFNWEIDCSNGQTNTGTNEANGTKSLSISGLSIDTQYTVWVNATNVQDGSAVTNAIYYFTSSGDLSVSSPSPSNNTIIPRTTTSLSVTIQDPEGDTFNWSIQTSPDIGSRYLTGQSNGTKSLTVTGNLSYAQSYTWYVNATDGVSIVNRSYSFTVQNLNPPSSLTATNFDSQAINVSWTKNSNVSHTYIRYEKDSYPQGMSGGNLLTNQTNTSYDHVGLDWGTHYYYRAWGFNDTDSVYSTSYAQGNAYTNPEHPSNFQVTSVVANTLDFQITKGTNATRTVLFMNATAGVYPNYSNGIVKDNDTGTTLTATGLNANTTYYFSVYSFNPDSGLWSELNDTVSETTATATGSPYGATATTVNDTRITLNWNKGDDYTAIFRRIGSSPDTGDTEIYNGTAQVFVDTDLTPATHYYYRLYGWDGESLSDGSATCDDITEPSPPINFSGQLTNNTLVITWEKGQGAVRTVIVNKTTGFPVDETDGTIQYNGTDITTIINGVSSIDYFVAFSYVEVDGEGVFSSPVQMSWGGIEINAYKETDPSVALTNYTVFITNQAGTETYLNTSANNPFRISVNDVPNGEDSIVQVSKDGYHTRTKYVDLYSSSFYQMNFYLPPDEEGSQGGDSGDDDFIPPVDEEDVLKSTSQSVSNPSEDLSFNLSCVPSLIVSVQGYNESLYGHWFTIPDDKYSLIAQVITINQSVLDENTSTVQVNYYCSNTESYANQYLITIINEIGEPVDDALVEVSLYVNTTEEYDTIYNVYSDGSGQVDMYLIVGTPYRFEISKTGYQTTIETYYPSGEKFTKDFTLYGEETDIPDQILPSEVITLTGEINGTNLNVNFSCTHGVIANTSLYVYERNVSTDIETLLNSSNTTLSNSWEEVIANINTSNGHRVTVFYNSNIWGLQRITILVNPDFSPPTTEDEVDELFELNYGSNPFGWSNFLLWILFALLLVKADKKDLGLILILIGGLSLTFSLIIGFNTTISIGAGGLLPMLMISLGVLQLWKSKRLSTWK